MFDCDVKQRVVEMDANDGCPQVWAAKSYGSRGLSSALGEGSKLEYSAVQSSAKAGNCAGVGESGYQARLWDVGDLRLTRISECKT